MTHPSLLPAIAAPRPAPARRPVDLRVRVQRIQVDDLTVTDPRQVLAHARQEAQTDPDTAALLGYSPTTPLTLHSAAALLSALYGTEDLAAMGLHPTRHTTRVSAANTGTTPVTLELSDTPDRES
ncbi:hypothetical protein OHA98_20560 [Streptomyces sp. NBC_00654]|uniref:hypothetical protein n=1 Tax=Streptomyces sp. NBC_00654 TaxID=2975799 RepID=UPI00224DEE7F|nr:hypothetical protein [Streptomyces sp. NBC_00654]MCX4967138.1 hypothetical protein [Streptomyces sp. NBC_00654]